MKVNLSGSWRQERCMSYSSGRLRGSEAVSSWSSFLVSLLICIFFSSCVLWVWGEMGDVDLQDRKKVKRVCKENGRCTYNDVDLPHPSSIRDMSAHDARCMDTAKSERSPMLQAHMFRLQYIQYEITCSLLPVCSLSNMTNMCLQTTLDGSRAPHLNFSRACCQDWSSRIIKKEFRNVSSCFPRRGSPLPYQSGWSSLFVYRRSFDNVWSLIPHTALKRLINRVYLFPPMQANTILRDLRPFPSLSSTL
jgi:hypothetical protein